MQHPNAVTVTDFGATSDGYLYIVMELLEGRTLRELWRASHRSIPRAQFQSCCRPVTRSEPHTMPD
jgi:serine/threonine protein kinase